MDEKELHSFLVVFSIIAFCLALTIIILFVIFQQRKNRLLRKQQEAENRFREEIVETQVEIREETLRNISWELHDNIGQLLTLAKIQLQTSDVHCPAVDEATDTIGQSLNELRSLSKLINPDIFKTLSLGEAIELEIQRFNRMKYLEASLISSEVKFDLDEKVELIIFRMLQEFFTNTIKHSRASKLSVAMEYTDDMLTITAFDDGVGFDAEKVERHDGIGLSNIRNRAELIDAHVQIQSRKGEGTKFYLTYKNKEL